MHKHRKGRTSKINVFLVTYLIRNQRVLLSLRFHIEILRFYYYLLFVLENIGRFNNGIRRKDKDNELWKAIKYRANRQSETDHTDNKNTKIIYT